MEERLVNSGDEDSGSSECKAGSPAAILLADPFLALLLGVDRSSTPSEAIDPSSSDEAICNDFLDSSSLT
jgi:hypothetical protein